jgi:hypothetical protein
MHIQGLQVTEIRFNQYSEFHNRFSAVCNGQLTAMVWTDIFGNCMAIESDQLQIQPLPIHKRQGMLPGPGVPLLISIRNNIIPSFTYVLEPNLYQNLNTLSFSANLRN